MKERSAVISAFALMSAVIAVITFHIFTVYNPPPIIHVTALYWTAVVLVIALIAAAINKKKEPNSHGS